MARLLVVVPLLSALAGCASLVGSATGRVAENISTAILNQNDVETVRDGAPAYLLMVDGLIEGDPENEGHLLAGARLYSAYASAFVEDQARSRRLADKAREYALRALCLRRRQVCRAADKPFAEFAATLDTVTRADVPALYGLAAAWAGWVQASPGDYNAIAELPKIEDAMRKVVELDEGYDNGGAHLYLGVLYSLRPAWLGGMPEQGRGHFERAQALSGGRNLMVKVLYAKQYARLVFDRALHDELLKEVLAADPQVPGLTLNNVLAQQQARELLESAEEYF